MACAICEIRRPRRFCPGVGGEICTLCCGVEREVTVHCPLECEYLQEAHAHEKVPGADPDQFPNRDIRVSEEFLRDHEPLLVFVAQSVLRAALGTPDAVDNDVREALDALIRTYRTLESGVYYETRPHNLLAASIYGLVQEAVNEFRRNETEGGMTRTRDANVLGVLAFLQRVELDRNNGRRLGRAFLGFLHEFFRPGREQGAEQPSSLIVP